MDDKQYKIKKDINFSKLFDNYLKIVGIPQSETYANILEEKPSNVSKQKEIYKDDNFTKNFETGQEDFLRRAFGDDINKVLLEEPKKNSIKIILEGKLIEDAEDFVRIKIRGKTVKIPKNYITGVE